MSVATMESPASALWLQNSVQSYFAQINWQSKPPVTETSELASEIGPTWVERPVSSSDLPVLSLEIKVGQFFASLNWQGQPALTHKPLPPNPSANPSANLSTRQSSRPSPEALLDMDLLENVFEPEAKSDQDVSIADFSDFF